MRGLFFQSLAPVVTSDPLRTDVACFVGFVRRRTAHSEPDPLEPMPDVIATWLRERGWTQGPFARSTAAELRDVPVPVDSWEAFDRLFAWEERERDPAGLRVGTYLGASVRSFFTEGGRKCYVVRVGDPRPLAELRDHVAEDLRALLPFDAAGRFSASPEDRSSWHGAAHLLGLDDVSILCLPDLPDLVRADATPPALPQPELETLREQFVECSTLTPRSDEDEDEDTDRRAPVGPAAPRCDGPAYVSWVRIVAALTRDLIARHRRDVQLVAALPLPTSPAALTEVEQRWLRRPIGPALRPDSTPEGGIASAFVQLAYPWLRTRGSTSLPEALESPDGCLAGLIARTALSRGTFRSAAGERPLDLITLEPLLRPERRTRLEPRVSLFGPSPSGWTLLTDHTTSADPGYRPAAVSRLIGLLLRAARRVGEELCFEPSGERLWSGLTSRLESLLETLYRLGALAGARPSDAFDVRCDRTTMTQADVDQGRVIAVVRVQPALPLASIHVVLALDEGGRVSLAETRPEQEAA